MTLRLGTRGSALALTQSGLVRDAIVTSTGRDVELVEIVTPGDRSGAPIAQLGVGVFVSALRDALLAKEIDLAVHSYKDLPTAPPGELVIAAVPARADFRDVLITRNGATLSQLGVGARIGTGAPRRIAQLLAVNPGLTPVPVRGNVDTRLRKLANGDLDALVLARAGLLRLGRADEATEVLEPEIMLPAPAQGALAIECRADDLHLRELLVELDHPHTRAAVTAERTLLGLLDAGCSAPVAALAEVIGADIAGQAPRIRLRGGVFSRDGQVALRLTRSVAATEETLLAEAERAGRELAADLDAQGARTVLGVAP